MKNEITYCYEIQKLNMLKISGIWIPHVPMVPWPDSHKWANMANMFKICLPRHVFHRYIFHRSIIATQWNVETLIGRYIGTTALNSNSLCWKVKCIGGVNSLHYMVVLHFYISLFCRVFLVLQYIFYYIGVYFFSVQCIYFAVYLNCSVFVIY